MRERVTFPFLLRGRDWFWQCSDSLPLWACPVAVDIFWHGWGYLYISIGLWRSSVLDALIVHGVKLWILSACTCILINLHIRVGAMAAVIALLLPVMPFFFMFVILGS